MYVNIVSIGLLQNVLHCCFYQLSIKLSTSLAADYYKTTTMIVTPLNCEIVEKGGFGAPTF